MMHIILEGVIAALCGFNGFMFGRYYEGKYGYYRKAMERWRALAALSVGLNELQDKLNEAASEKRPDGSMVSPYQIKKN